MLLHSFQMREFYYDLGYSCCYFGGGVSLLGNRFAVDQKTMLLVCALWVVLNDETTHSF